MQIEWNNQNIAIAGVAAVGASLMGFAVWLGVFKKVQVKEGLFPGGTFVYMDW
jgi:hypothetical protein